MLQNGDIIDIDYLNSHTFGELIPQELISYFDSAFAANYVYVKGFIEIKGLPGCILIISPKRLKANNLAVIDYYINICTIALQKRAVEIELKNYDVKFESKLKRRTQKLEDKLEQLQKEKSEIIEHEHHLEYIKDTLADSLSKEKELNELKTRFIETVTHEYRTPLTVIQTSTYILQRYFENNDAENFQKQLSKIIASVKDMTDLLQDILTYGRGDHENISPKAERFGIISFVNDIIESQKIIDNGRHRINFIVNSKTNEVIIYSDMRCVQYVFGNILQNAIKYSPQGTDIDIILTNRAREICIEVRDRGRGIPENELDYLFEPFFRGSKVNTIPGTGLGLAIAKRYSDLLGGSINVKSKIDVGTTFTFSLPKIITRK